MGNSIEDVYRYINDNKDEIIKKVNTVGKTVGNYNKEKSLKYEIVKPGYVPTSYYINFNIINPNLI